MSYSALYKHGPCARLIQYFTDFVSSHSHFLISIPINNPIFSTLVRLYSFFFCHFFFNLLVVALLLLADRSSAGIFLCTASSPCRQTLTTGIFSLHYPLQASPYRRVSYWTAVSIESAIIPQKIQGKNYDKTKSKSNTKSNQF